MICERCGTVFCWDNADEGTLDGGRKRYCGKVCARKATAKRQRDRDEPERLARQRAFEGSLLACAVQGKQQYASDYEALAAAAEVFGWTGQRLRAYRCPGTSHWHLTKKGTGNTPSGQMAAALKRALAGEEPS